jgi:putative oxidoreductase
VSGKTSGWTEEIALNLLRVVAGFLFWQHGIQKLFGILGREAPVEFFTQFGLAGVLETVGGVFLVLGLFSRPVAFILSGEMAWAYFAVHAPENLWPIMNGGELPALYAFVFLFIAARGGGAFGLDGLIRTRKGRKPPPAPEASPEPAPEDDFPELTEEDLAEDPEIAELLGDDPKA